MNYRIANLLLSGLLAIFALQPARSAAPDIYPPPEQASADLAAALQTAAAPHRRVILDFGGNWCPDCHVLDIYMHATANQQIIDSSFVVVHINIGKMDRN